MNKDILVASIVGFSLGLVGAVGLWVVPKMLPKITKPQSSPMANISDQVLGENAQINIELSNIKDGDIVKENNFELKGKSTNTNFLSINTPQSQQILKTDKESTFSANLKLNEGGNQIVVTGYNQGSEITKKLIIYYFAENL